MKVRHDEGVANRIDPEPCDANREGCVEASVGEHIGQPWSRERLNVSGADVVRNTEGDMDERVSASGRPARRGRRPSHGDVSVKGKIHSRMSKTPMAVSASKV